MTDKIRPFSTSVVRLIPRPQPERSTNLPYREDRIEIFWPDDNKFCPGTVTLKSDDGKFVVSYDDVDRDELDLDKENWRFIDERASESQVSVMINQCVQKSSKESDWRSTSSFTSLYKTITEALFDSDVSQSTFEEFSERGIACLCMTVVVKDKFDPRFDKAKQDEIENLLKPGTYKSVPESDIGQTDKILQSRFVLTIKNHGEEDEFFKARLVILCHVDPEKSRVVNDAPTVMKSSIRTT